MREGTFSYDVGVNAEKNESQWFSRSLPALLLLALRFLDFLFLTLP